ncbi:hypothetical protein ACLKA7_000595 [Drosophila subpalustris]
MSNEEDETVPRNHYKSFKDRKTIWYTKTELSKKGTCPSCGRSIGKFKNITAHVKRCFSIKKIGPIHRLHGYVECKCGLLIADSNKAKKLHICMGEVPAFEPELNYAQTETPPALRDDQTAGNQGKMFPPKPWIRNFVSPIKLDIENRQVNTKSEPRVRNFDMAANSLEPHNVSVYSISSNNGAIFVKGHSPKSGKKGVLLISKPELRLPRLKGDHFS